MVTTDEFIGSTYTLNYLIDREELHAGRNFGRIHIHGVGTDLTFEVRVHGGILRKKDGNLKEQHRELAALYDCYMDFRLKRIQAETWVERSIRAWDEIHEGRRNGNHDGTHPHSPFIFRGKRRRPASFWIGSSSRETI